MLPQSDLPTRKPLILLVDDEEIVRKTMCRWLERIGYAVHAAENGLDALGYALWPGNQVDLVVTDVDMPKLGGPNFVEQLQEAYPAVPVLYVSGYPRSIFAFLDANPALPYLQKPFALDELSASVQKLVPPTPIAVWPGSPTGSVMRQPTVLSS